MQPIQERIFSNDDILKQLPLKPNILETHLRLTAETCLQNAGPEFTCLRHIATKFRLPITTSTANYQQPMTNLFFVQNN